MIKEKVRLDSTYVPKVLLLGNGINNWSGRHSWANLLVELCTKEEVIAYLKDDKRPKRLPMSMQAVLATNDNISEAIKTYNSKKGEKSNTNPFYGKITSEKQREALEKILSAGFDAILTTNYSYEIELAALGKEEFTSPSQIEKYTNSLTDLKDRKYLTHTFNDVTFRGVRNRVFHIHGEARKPGGIILGSYYYAKLLQRIITESDARSNRYQINQMRHALQEYDSWIDYFLLGEVHVLGFGFDFAEIDLWWLLNRKKNEKASVGKVHYYDLFTDGFNEKNEMLKLMGAEIHNFGIVLEEGHTQPIKNRNNRRFDEFYPKAIEYISK